MSLRVERHCENAQKVAEFLDAHEKVSHVIYAGLPDDKYHELAQKSIWMREEPVVLFPLN